MLDRVAVKTGQPPCNGLHIEGRLAAVFLRQIQAQLSTVTALPTGVEIKNDGELSGAVVLKGIEVAFVKGPLRVYGQVELHIAQPQVIAAVEVLDQLGQFPEKRAERLRRRRMVEPLYMVAPDLLVDPMIAAFAYTGPAELPLPEKRGCLFLHFQDFRSGQETIGYGITICGYGFGYGRYNRLA